MLKWLIRRRLAAFGKKYGYDTGYLNELMETDYTAFKHFARAVGGGKYRGEAPRDAWHTVALVTEMHDDCGPCAQLAIDMALEEGVAPAALDAVVRGDAAAMPADVALAWRYATATLAHDPAADEAREEAVARWGERAVAALALAITLGRLYPTLKYALGHGRACQLLRVTGVEAAHRAA